jgi:hypothetical protein
MVLILLTLVHLQTATEFLCRRESNLAEADKTVRFIDSKLEEIDSPLSRTLLDRLRTRYVKRKNLNFVSLVISNLQFCFILADGRLIVMGLHFLIVQLSSADIDLFNMIIGIVDTCDQGLYYIGHKNCNFTTDESLLGPRQTG